MLRQEITYKNFHKEEITKTFYFNLTKAELLLMEISPEGGLDKILQRMIETVDANGMIEMVKKLVLQAYGERSDDGDSFLKEDADGRPLSNKFKQTQAFSDLFYKLATDDQAMIEWLSGVIPEDLQEEVAKEAATTPGAPALVGGVMP